MHLQFMDLNFCLITCVHIRYVLYLRKLTPLSHLYGEYVAGSKKQ